MQRFRPAALLWVVLSTMLGGVLGLLYGLVNGEQTYLEFLVYVFCRLGFSAGIPAALTVLIMIFARVSRRLCTLIGAAVAFLGWALVLARGSSADFIIYALPVAAVAGLFFWWVARPPAAEGPAAA